MKRCPVCGVESEGMVLHEGNHAPDAQVCVLSAGCKWKNNQCREVGYCLGNAAPAAQASPTWEELDAIRKGKSDIDLAERIWRLERAAENTAPNLRNMATGWIATSKTGEVLHFSKADGWTVEVVALERTTKP